MLCVASGEMFLHRLELYQLILMTKKYISAAFLMASHQKKIGKCFHVRQAKLLQIIRHHTRLMKNIFISNIQIL